MHRNRSVRIAFFPLALGALLLCRAIAGGPGPSAFAGDAPGPLKAILEVDRESYYGGDPVPMRLSIWNDGAVPAEAPGGPIEAGFDLRDADGKKIEITGMAGAPAGQGAAKTLLPGAFLGLARDFTSLYPRLKQPGTYRIQWTSGDLVSNAIVLKVVPRYDPERNYVARIETDAGAFSIEFLRRDAPIAVKTFVELASSGFFDGQIFHYVEPGRLVMSGDPTGTGLGGPGFTIPIEHPQVKMLAGTVFLRPTKQGPTNGSVFGILLAPRPDLEGQQTPFGQVVDGLGVVSRISEAPATPNTASPPHRPLKDIKITRVTVKPKA